MNKEMAVYAVNAIVALAAFALVYFGKATWEQVALLIAALLTPSGVHVAMSRKDPKDEPHP